MIAILIIKVGQVKCLASRGILELRAGDFFGTSERA